MNSVWILLAAVFWVGQSSAQETMPEAPKQVHPLMVGDEVPALTLVDINGDTFDLGAHKKPTVLVFYRGYW